MKKLTRMLSVALCLTLAVVLVACGPTAPLADVAIAKNDKTLTVGTDANAANYGLEETQTPGYYTFSQTKMVGEENAQIEEPIDFISEVLEVDLLNRTLHSISFGGFTIRESEIAQFFPAEEEPEDEGEPEVTDPSGDPNGDATTLDDSTGEPLPEPTDPLLDIWTRTIKIDGPAGAFLLFAIDNVDTANDNIYDTLANKDNAGGDLETYLADSSAKGFVGDAMGDAWVYRGPDGNPESITNADDPGAVTAQLIAQGMSESEDVLYFGAYATGIYTITIEWVNLTQEKVFHTETIKIQVCADKAAAIAEQARIDA
jgi:hypothetical protein